MSYQDLLKGIKDRIKQAQRTAITSVNAEMLALYWDIGRMIDTRQDAEGWGRAVVPQLARDIRNELSTVKGFSERNLNRMLAFYREYKYISILPTSLPASEADMQKEGETELPIAILPPAVAKLEEVLRHSLFQVSWANNVILMEKVKDLKARIWYMKQAVSNGWTRDELTVMIKNNLYDRQGKATTNFSEQLPAAQSCMAVETLKDPYVFDFLTIEEPFHERELEAELVQHLEKFLMELGAGFAFVGRQYHLEISDQDFYIDLLFYHLKLRCFVVIELKKGTFKPEYAGKLNFYCSVVDDILRHKDDNQTIGLILCQMKDKVLAEYTLRGIQKPIGISEYELTKVLPDSLKSTLPSIEEIEAALTDKNDEVCHEKK